jgi:hypothetical protein
MFDVNSPFGGFVFLGTQLLWIVGPFIFLWLALPFVWKKWMSYAQANFLDSIEWELLYIKLPKQVAKTPQAMEFILQTLYQTGGTGTWFARWWEGKVRDYFSLEIVSIEGNVYFFIRTKKGLVDLIKAGIYAQYPLCEVYSVDDYTKFVPPYENKESLIDVTGCEFILAKEDALPIATYLDFGMDKALSLEEEQRIDPLSPIIEYMGSLKKGEQLWLQIMVRASTNRYTKAGDWYQSLTHGWTDEGKNVIKKFYEEVAKYQKEFYGVEKTDPTKLTPPQKQTIESIERNMAKFGFDTGIRCIYLGFKDAFSGGRAPHIFQLFKHYGMLNNKLNSFKPQNIIGRQFDFPWQAKQKDIVTQKEKQLLFENYVHRKYFHEMPDSAGDIKFYQSDHEKRDYVQFVLTTEELATIFHFPGAVIQTPTLDRAPLIKSQAPQNLPF